jgi:TP901 family phage tail tape measure protein
MATFNAGTVQADVEISRDKLQGSVNGAISDLRRLSTEGGQAGEQAGEETGQRFGSGLAGALGGGLEGIVDKVKEKLSGLASSGAGLGTLAGAGIGLALAAGLMVAIDMEPARQKLTAQLNLTAVESGRIGGVAGQLYAHAYGESFEEVTGAIRLVIQNIDGMRDASASDLQAITGQVMSLSSAFDQDLGATTRAVGQMMKTGMAANATEALDIIATGFTMGADKAEDFLDTLNEYGTQFRKLGIDGKEATGLITQGLQAGARDADIVADAFKEFAIRAVDGSELTSTSLTKLGVNARQVSAAIAGGGIQAANATDLVLDKLRAVADPAERAAIAVGLFGTQSEDLGEALFALDLSSAAADLGEVAGAAARVDTAMGDTAAGGLTSIGRGLQLLAEDLGQAVLPAVKFLITGLLGLLDAVGGVADIIGSIPGPILLAAAVMGGWAIAAGLASAATAAFSAALEFLSVAMKRVWAALGPIGILAAVVTTAMSFLMDSTDGAAETAQAAGERWDRLKGTLDGVSGAVTAATKAQLVQEAQSSGMLSTIESLGVSTEAYIDASAGAAGGAERLGSSVQDAANKLLMQSDAYKAAALDIARAGISQQEFTAAMEAGDITGVTAQVTAYAEEQGRLTGNVSTTQDILNRFNAAVADGQGPLAALGGIMNQSGSDADGFAAAADAAEQRARALGESGVVVDEGLSRAGDAAAGATETLSPMEAALKGASDATSALDSATQFLALTLDIASGGMISQDQATRANEAALRDVAAATRDSADAQQDMQAKAEAVGAAVAEFGGSSKEAAAAQGEYEDAVDKAADSLDTQSESNVRVQSTAIAQAAALASTAAANGSLKGATDIATASLQKSKDAFIAAQPEADRLTGKAQATADALFGVPSATATKMVETGAIQVQGAAHDTTAAVGDIPDYHNTNLTTSGDALGTLQSIRREVDNMPTSKIIQVRTERSEVVYTTTTGAAFQADGGHLHAADGLVTGRGMSQRRKGSGGGVTWAEGITSEEFYISMKPGMEIRNRGFLSEAASKLGGRVSWSQDDAAPPAADPFQNAAGSASRLVTVGSVNIGRFDDADQFFDRMAWEQSG